MRRKPVLFSVGTCEGCCRFDTPVMGVEGGNTVFKFGGAFLIPHRDTQTQPHSHFMSSKRQDSASSRNGWHW